MVTECVDDLASASVIAAFFSTDRALDRSRMHIDAEFLVNQLRQFARPDWLSRRELCDEKRQHLALNLVRAVWTSLVRHQARNACFVEIPFGLVKSRTRDAILVGHLCDRSLLDRDAAQHLVFYLYNIERIEESAFLKLRIADLVGRRIQGAVFSVLLRVSISHLRQRGKRVWILSRRTPLPLSQTKFLCATRRQRRLTDDGPAAVVHRADIPLNRGPIEIRINVNGSLFSMLACFGMSFMLH